jgi:hypothetical protein
VSYANMLDMSNEHFGNPLSFYEDTNLVASNDPSKCLSSPFHIAESTKHVSHHHSHWRSPLRLPDDLTTKVPSVAKHETLVPDVLSLAFGGFHFCSASTNSSRMERIHHHQLEFFLGGFEQCF